MSERTFPFFLVALILVCLIVAMCRPCSAEAESGIFYQWTTPEGTISFTDNQEKVPPMFLSGAKSRRFSELTDKRLTPMAISQEEYAASLHMPEPSAPTENPNLVEDCSQPVSAYSERRQFGDFNRTVYIVKDECGKIITESFDAPKFLIPR